LIVSETRGIAIPHQLGNNTAFATHNYEGYPAVTGFGGGSVTTIGSPQQSSYTQGTGITGGTSACSNSSLGGHPQLYLNSTATEAHKGNALSNGVNASSNAINNVVREARALSNGTTSDFYGNIALGPNLWPFIQLYDFTRYQSYDLVYEKGGGDEVITLTYDRPGNSEGLPKLSFDKEHYGLKHEVGVTIANNEYNLDPTDEDSWTFGTLPSNATLWYNLFDENGARQSDNSAGAIQFTLGTGTATFGFDSAVLKIDVNGPEHSDTVATSTTPDVLFFQDNGDQIVVCDSGVCGSSSVSMANQAVTFTETGANTGLFTNWDDSLKTNTQPLWQSRLL
jgi:hypothetical protein